MHLLYVDESGSPSDENQNYFVLSGISVFEKKAHWVEKQLNEIAARFCPDDPYSIELHGAPMRLGKGEWRSFSNEERSEAIIDCLKIIADSKRQIRIFAAVLEKGAGGGEDPIRCCFEQVASRFDMYLGRLHAQGDSQRGIAIFDKSTTEKSIQHLARDFKHNGHAFGRTKNFAEVPLFLDSKASRLIQLADLVAYAIFRNFERNDPRYYSVIQDCFDQVGTTKHGLYVRKRG